MKFHENPSSGSRGVPCEQTDGRMTEMTELIVAFLNFANAPKNDFPSLLFKYALLVMFTKASSVVLL
jgi:hypothetical protein